MQTLPRKLSIEAKQNRNSNNHWRKITEYKKLRILIFKCAIYNPKLSGIQRTKKMEHSFKKKKKKKSTNSNSKMNHIGPKKQVAIIICDVMEVC